MPSMVIDRANFEIPNYKISYWWSYSYVVVVVVVAGATVAVVVGGCFVIVSF